MNYENMFDEFLSKTVAKRAAVASFTLGKVAGFAPLPMQRTEPSAAAAPIAWAASLRFSRANVS